VSAAEAERLDGEPRPPRLRIANGVLYSFLQIPARDTPGLLVGEIHAAGEGRVTLWTSTCIRTPAPGVDGRPFSHDIRKDAGPFKLAPDPSRFRFAVPLDPYEQGYLYLNVAGEAALSHVSAVLTDRPASAGEPGALPPAGARTPPPLSSGD